ncbi:MAG: 3-phosphoshikimate 1-carboxyvinyltransferase [Verrucomicrobia bacterium]|nr:3-phosphoshikimate 1-carboxyvinyltransferase [Verrucomicrobiota bacterium]
MPLPPLIEIIPLTSPVRAEITVPGSKSITNRALILAALADGRTTLRGALWSEDTQVMADCLRALGFTVDVQPDPAESCNRTITVDGLGGRLPRAGTVAQPLELFVGNAGTAARFLAAMVCLGDGVYRLSGVPRMHERPQAALFAALRELGYRVDSPNDKLPATLFGRRRREESLTSSPEPKPKTQDPNQRLLTSSPTGKCSVSVTESSQFASALLLAGGVGGWQVEITGANEDELPYVDMTRELVKVFPAKGGEFQIEPDASSGSYFFAATSYEVLNQTEHDSPDDLTFIWETTYARTISVRNWPQSGWQIDAKFPEFLTHDDGSVIPSPEQSTAEVQALVCSEQQAREYKEYLERFEKEFGTPTISRRTDLGDSIMTAIVLSPRSQLKTTFTDLGRLRVQECERVVALRTELTKCGAKVTEEGDTLTVFPSALHGAEIETYDDHRMAMCFAVLGLKVPGIKIKNPACVKKTFPNFFQKLATPPPHGLGAEIRDAATGRKLAVEELFAD